MPIRKKPFPAIAWAVAMAAVVAVALAVGCTAPAAPTPTPSPTPMPSPTPEATRPVNAAPGGATPDGAAPGGAVREVTVGPELVDCVGSHPMRCLVVDGELFYDPIEGFKRRDGYRYRLLIEEYDRFPGQTEIPQDTGRYGYRLVAVLEETPP